MIGIRTISLRGHRAARRCRLCQLAPMANVLPNARDFHRFVSQQQSPDHPQSAGPPPDYYDDIRKRIHEIPLERHHRNDSAAQVRPANNSVARSSAQSLIDSEKYKRNPAAFEGFRYELEVIETLQHYNFELQHTGSAHDKGIDFRGVWHLSSGEYQHSLSTTETSTSPSQQIGESEHHLRVAGDVAIIGQCKKEAIPIGPHYVREIEGVLSRIHSDSNTVHHSTLAIFVSHSGYTVHTIRYAMGSSWPIILTIVRGGSITYFQTNAAAQRLLPTEIVAGCRRTRRDTASTQTMPAVPLQRQLVLMQQVGHKLIPIRNSASSNSNARPPS